MSYIDGFLIPVTAANKEVYREVAVKSAALLKEFGSIHQHRRCKQIHNTAQ